MNNKLLQNLIPLFKEWKIAEEKGIVEIEKKLKTIEDKNDEENISDNNKENMTFSDLSEKLTKELSLKVKKSEGIFFTPQNIVKKTVNDVLKYVKLNKLKFNNILEPSCGSGEFIDYLEKKVKNKTIDCVELNKTIFDEVSMKKYAKNEVKFFNEDFLKYDSSKTYDLIFGNPPYFVIKKKDILDIDKEYITGRPNIFCLFIIHSLRRLNKDGILAFVLPNSFLNSSYYEKVRKLIWDKYHLVKIINFNNINKFKDTQQSTSTFIIQNKIMEDKTNDYIIEIGGRKIFTDKKKELEELIENSTTLKKLGFKVKNGDTVWNQLKDILTDDEKETILVYSSNIKNNEFELTSFPNNEKKKQYIKRTGLTGPRIIISRGYGNSKYVLNYALLDIDKQYLLENHIISIFYEDDNLSKDELLKKFNKIIKSFKQKETSKFVDIFSGNNAMNTTEIQNMLPIYGF
tara:strand:+ start:1647 stop:3023 length:1377 start_codon:yes stop_codon:yes gene_type:complete